jgi:hypothetical protein
VQDTLPTFFHYGKKQEVFKTMDRLDLWLDKDLDFERLDKIHKLLWMCGRTMNARALHKQMLMGRRIFITEQADLHLLYYSDIIMIKPLPAYILCKEMWEEYLNKDRDLHRSACGLLMSYIWLIRSTHDFQIATRDTVQLLPTDLTWLEWKRIVDRTLKYIDPDSLHQVHRRFQFGELRLGRINTIYRLNPRLIHKNFVRGYLYGYNRYAPFLQRNVAWVLAVSVLFSLVLSAMQVGTGLPNMNTNTAFKNASFGFVIFACVLVGAVLAFVILTFGYIFLFNMVVASNNAIQEQKRRKKLMLQKASIS